MMKARPLWPRITHERELEVILMSSTWTAPPSGKPEHQQGHLNRNLRFRLERRPLPPCLERRISQPHLSGVEGSVPRAPA